MSRYEALSSRFRYLTTLLSFQRVACFLRRLISTYRLSWTWQNTCKCPLPLRNEKTWMSHLNMGTWTDTTRFVCNRTPRIRQWCNIRLAVRRNVRMNRIKPWICAVIGCLQTNTGWKVDVHTKKIGPAEYRWIFHRSNSHLNDPSFTHLTSYDARPV